MGTQISHQVTISSGTRSLRLERTGNKCYQARQRFPLGDRFKVEVTAEKICNNPCFSTEQPLEQLSSVNYHLTLDRAQSRYLLDIPPATITVSREAGTGEILFDSYALS
jgi:hypothetical protein